MTVVSDLSRWWTLPGPRAFIGRVIRASVAGDGVTVIQVPTPQPKGLADAIAARFAEELALRTVAITGSDLDLKRSVAHELAGACGLVGSAIGNITDFVRSSELSDIVFIVDGLSRLDLVRWGLFVRALREERRKSRLVSGPFLLIMAPRGLNQDESRQLTGRADHCLWLGFLSKLDSSAWLAQLGVRQGSSLLDRIGIATVIEIAAWSVDLLEVFAGLAVDEQVSPFAKLDALARNGQWPFPSWQNGLVDLWEDVPVPHAAAALAHSIPHEIDRRVWVAQTSVILPFVDEVRRGIIRKYLDVLGTHVSPQSPYRKTVFDREFVIESPWQLEWHELQLFLGSKLSSDETKFFKACRWARDQMAHAKCIELRNLKSLSEWWEALRDIHAAATTGWDWPRAGQTLTLTVGPPEARKSTWASEQGLPIVSWDLVQRELAGSMGPSGDRSAVSREVRRRAASLMRSGTDAIIDATNITPEERLQNVTLAPPDMPVRYVVIDGPQEHKSNDLDSGRGDPNFVASLRAQFEIELNSILKGDDRANVSVVDLRAQAITVRDVAST